MKKGITLTILVLVVNVMLYAQNLSDGNGSLIATIDTAGIVKDANNIQVGQFMPNGEIKGEEGSIIGKIEGNQFKDEDNDLMGSINSAGEVMDLSNVKIGEIPNSTTIKGAIGETIGTASSAIDKKWLAGYYFFYFKNTY